MKTDIIKMIQKNMHWILFILFIVVISVTVYNTTKPKERFSVSSKIDNYNLNDIKNEAIEIIEKTKFPKDTGIDKLELKKIILDIPQEVFNHYLDLFDNKLNEGFTVGIQSFSDIIYVILRIFIIILVALFTYRVQSILLADNILFGTIGGTPMNFMGYLVSCMIYGFGLLFIRSTPQQIAIIEGWIEGGEDTLERRRFILRLIIEAAIENAQWIWNHDREQRPRTRILNGWNDWTQINVHTLNELYRQRRDRRLGQLRPDIDGGEEYDVD
tara:strand:+ start:4098 stop:4910 length:813 start_codon:yes stop_codon:yes gene_type:complete